MKRLSSSQVPGQDMTEQISTVAREGRFTALSRRRLHLREVTSEFKTYTGIGAELKTARVNNGLDLEAVSLKLRIRKAYLSAIEEGCFEELPAQVYAIGFVRAYADYLRLDENSAVDTFKQEASDLKGETKLVFPLPIPESRVPTGLLIGISLVVAGLIYVGWFYAEMNGQLATDSINAVPEELLAVEDGLATSDLAGSENLGAIPANNGTGKADSHQVLDTATNKLKGITQQKESEVFSELEKKDLGQGQKLPNSSDSTNVEALSEKEPVTTETDQSEVNSNPKPDIKDAISQSDSDDSQKKFSSSVVLDSRTSARSPPILEPPPKQPRSVSSNTQVNPETQEGEVRFDSMADYNQGERTRSPLGLVENEIAAQLYLPNSRIYDVPRMVDRRINLESEVTREKSIIGELVLGDGSKNLEQTLEGSADGGVGLEKITSSNRNNINSNGRSQVYGAGSWDARVVIEATNEVWVQILTEDGFPLLTRILQPGDRYLVPNRDGLVLMTGNAGAIEIFVDGQPLPPIGDIGVVLDHISLIPERLIAGTAIGQ